MLLVTELFNTAVNDIHAKKSVCYSWVLIVTELVLSGTPCIATSAFKIDIQTSHTPISESFTKLVADDSFLFVRNYDAGNMCHRNRREDKKAFRRMPTARLPRDAWAT